MCNFDMCWYEDVCGIRRDGCQKACARYHEMKYMMDTSNIPKSKQLPSTLEPDKCDLDAFYRLAAIKDNIVDVVAAGKNIYIASHVVGNGKTSWALKLILKYFDSMWDGNGFVSRGVFIHVPTFLLKCKDFKVTDQEFEDLKKRLLEVDLVVWDDIAGSNATSYDYSQLLMYLDAREFRGLSNIFTSNITSKDDLARSLGSKVASRVWNSNTEVIEFRGGERR